MKIAVLSESPSDEAALRVLVSAVLKQEQRFVAPGFRARGWPNVGQLMPAVLRHLHFNTDTDLLVVVVDSDDSVVHTARHDAPDYFHPHCRLCQLRAIYRQTTKRLPRAHGRDRLIRALGVAVPAMEAWYLCGRDETVSEAAWLAGQERGRLPYTRAQLKGRVYGTDRPGLPLQTACAVREAERHRRDLRRLEHDFPGFAALAEDLRRGAAAPEEETHAKQARSRETRGPDVGP